MHGGERHGPHGRQGGRRRRRSDQRRLRAASDRSSSTRSSRPRTVTSSSTRASTRSALPGRSTGTCGVRVVQQGGSTITQQYVKNALDLTREKSITRKINEAVLSVKLERGDVEAGDPRGLPQHDLLRPGRVRRGRRQPGLLRPRRARPEVRRRRGGVPGRAHPRPQPGRAEQAPRGGRPAPPYGPGGHAGRGVHHRRRRPSAADAVALTEPYVGPSAASS